MGLSRLKPADPAVERETVLIDTVKRGEMLRQVRGTGTLVPEQILWIAAATDGRVERLSMLPGAVVKADTVLLLLSNPELELSAQDAELKLRAAEAEYRNQQVKLESQKMDQQADAAEIKADYLAAKLRAQADEELAKEGLVANITLQISKAKAEELATRYEIELKRIEVNLQSAKAQLDAQQAGVDQVRASYALKRRQVEALHVRAGADGVLQQLPVGVGQRVTAGTILAKIAQPEQLKAELKIPETQAKDILIGQSANIDTRNGIIPGKVIRIDPAVANGTVAIDVSLQGTLPKGARPDLTVDGTIELEHLQSVLYVGRPATGGEHSSIGLFKLEPEGNGAVRVQVKLGRTSVNAVEVIEGLKENDQVILSDMSQWDAFERIRLN